jgi:hypothetical protein
VPVSDVVLVKPHTILKTTSGRYHHYNIHIESVILMSHLCMTPFNTDSLPYYIYHQFHLYITLPGKLRRAATRDALNSNEFNSNVLRRSTIARMKTFNTTALPASSEQNSSINNNHTSASKVPIHQLIQQYGDGNENQKQTAVVNEWRIAPAIQAKLKAQEEQKKDATDDDNHTATSASASMNEHESIQRGTLDIEDVKRRLIHILSDEIHMSEDAIQQMSKEFVFDETKTLDEYGLDSVCIRYRMLCIIRHISPLPCICIENDMMIATRNSAV